METQTQPLGNRYSDSDLEMFKNLILAKIITAKEEFNVLTSSLSHANANGTDDDANSYRTLEGGGAILEKESTNQLAGRQKKNYRTIRICFNAYR